MLAVERRTTERVAMWERLVLMIVAPVIAASILGVYSAIVDLGERQQEVAQAQAVNQAVTQSQITDVRARLEGIYTERQADAEHTRIFRTDKDQYSRLDDHESRIRRLEAR